MSNRIVKLLKNPYKAFVYLGYKGYLNKLNDKTYLKLIFRGMTGKKLDLKNPQTFDEKLQWLKLYDRKPEYTMMVDKYAVREYIAKTIGEEYLIPLLGVWDSPEEIDFDALPDRFVMKCNHNSGKGMIICKDKSKLDVELAKKKLSEGLAEDYYLTSREWPYKNVRRKIIAEKYMEDNETKELRDYKFFCFDGEAKALYITTEWKGAETEGKMDFFDINFNHLDIRRKYPNADVPPEKPKNFDEMRRLAEKLSQNILHLRVDFYEVNGKTYFGELTFTTGAGFATFEQEEWEKTFGDWIKLPEAN